MAFCCKSKLSLQDGQPLNLASFTSQITGLSGSRGGCRHFASAANDTCAETRSETPSNPIDFAKLPGEKRLPREREELTLSEVAAQAGPGVAAEADGLCAGAGRNRLANNNRLPNNVHP